MPNCRTCTHIKVTGVRCGSPALRGERFCYFHQRVIKTVPCPDSRLHHVALLEDPESIQAAIMELVNALIRGTIELKRAELILRALNTAVRNARHVHFEFNQDDMVRQVPNFEDDDASVAAPIPAPDSIPAADPIPAHLVTASPAGPSAPAHVPAAPAPVGTAAPGCPSGPASPVRGAVPSAPDTARPKPPAAVAPSQPKPAAHRASAG